MKFFIKLVILKIVFTWTIVQGFKKSKSNSNVLNQIETVNLIQSELDNLIRKLDHNKPQDSKKIIHRKDESNKGFTDQIFNAFQTLNHDFLEYENLLDDDAKNTNENNQMKNLYYENDKKYSKLCNLHTNITKTNEKSDLEFYNEVQEITQQIEDTVEKIARIEQNDKKEKKIKEKIELIENIKVKISELKNKLYLIKENRKRLTDIKGKLIYLKENREQLSVKKEKIKESIRDLIKMYDKYLQMETKVKSQLQEELVNIKNDFSISSNHSAKISNYLNLYEKVHQFYHKLNSTQNLSQIKNDDITFLQFNNFIKNINTLDKSTAELKSKISGEVENIDKNKLGIPAQKRVLLLNQQFGILKSLKGLNNKVMLIKLNLSNNLKDMSFSNLSELLRFIKNKKDVNRDKQNKLVHLKNALQIGHRLFENQSTIDKIKSKIMEYINQAHKNILLKEVTHNIQAFRSIQNRVLENIQHSRQNILQARQNSERKHKIFIIDQLKKLQNTRAQIIDKSKLISVHRNLIQRFLNIRMYLNQLEAMKKVFHTKKEQILLNIKIKRVFEILKHLKNLIFLSRSLLERIQTNSELSDDFHAQHDNLISKVEELKLDLNSSDHFTNEELEDIRLKLRKLSELYMYLKQGSIHNFIHTELMKKLVDINSTLTNKFDIMKLFMHIALSK